MQKLIIHVSALIGLLIFLNQAWTYAPLDRALMTSIGTGLGIYLVLFLGTILIRRIAAQAPPPEDETSDGESAEAKANAKRSASTAQSQSSPAPNRSSEPSASDAASEPDAPSAASSEREAPAGPVAAPTA